MEVNMNIIKIRNKAINQKRYKEITLTINKSISQKINKATFFQNKGKYYKKLLIVLIYLQFKRKNRKNRKNGALNLPLYYKNRSLNSNKMLLMI